VQVVQFVIGIILARLLAPEDFGLIAMLTVFIALAEVFVDSGLSSALIQKRQVTVQDESTMFYVNIAIALAAYGLLWLVAPHIAGFYRQPALQGLLRVLSLVIIIRSFAIIQTTFLRKRLDFRSLFFRGLLSFPVSGAVGITMAYRGCGVWSLVAQQLVCASLNVACYWIRGRWRPRLIFSMGSFKALTGFGSRQLAAGLLDTLFQNIYHVVIGRLFSAVALGYYARAVSLERLAVNNLSTVASRVVFPLFCKVHHDVERLRAVASKTLAMLAMIMFPVMVGLIVVATPLISVVLSPKWLPSVPYFRLLCIVGMLYPLHVVNVNLLRARGEMGAFLKLEFLKKGLTVAAILVTWRWGILAMVWGQVLLSVVNYYLNAHFGGRAIGFSWRSQCREVFPYFLATIVMATCTAFVGYLVRGNMTARLLVQISTGVITYCVCCRMLRLPEFRDAWKWAVHCVESMGVRLGFAGTPGRA